MEDGTRECRQPPEDEKSKGTDFAPEPPERNADLIYDTWSVAQ